MPDISLMFKPDPVLQRVPGFILAMAEQPEREQTDSEATHKQAGRECVAEVRAFHLQQPHRAAGNCYVQSQIKPDGSGVTLHVPAYFSGGAAQFPIRDRP